MSRYALLVCRDQDLASAIQDRLQDGLSRSGNALIVDHSRNAADAKNRLSGHPYHLLVTESEIPADRSAPLNPQAHDGVALVREVQSAGIPSVVLATSVSGALLEETQRLDRCYLALQGEEHWDDRLLRQCEEALQLTPPLPKPSEETHVAEAEIVVNLAEEKWTYKLEGFGFPYEATGSLQIQQDAIAELQELSEKIGENDPTWESKLHEAGSKLMEQIFKNNAEFNSRFSRLVGMVGKERNVKIEFVVDQTIQGVALESVLEIEGRNYWMLQAPVYRKFRKHEAYPLFATEAENRTPIRCLIIEANVSGDLDVRGQSISLADIANVGRETEWLRCYLEQNRAQFNIGCIEHVKQARPGQTFLETVSQLGRGKQWDLVHYAGHSYYQNAQGGFLFLPGDQPEIVTAELFSLKLERPRFVYLSCCQSSQAPFVFTLAEKNAGAILGFRWDIEDNEAFDYAKIFYRALFETDHKLEYAFLRARQDMHGRYEQNKIWASPILMM